ncbi:MAG TPA: GntR family transcriptional regulator [Candidatus Hydrogenedentes bacterium]|nr:GntR family transcriptional regulator [Candidatus Hydrogenedentota bacterium]HOV74886.1 GntR family transcriptional regulator [Candidatus Hydrogenedentota bacterium]
MDKGLQSASPLYELLVERYRDDILHRRLQPGDRLDSITQIQRKHGVARETAKRVLNILEQDGLVIQRAGKGTFVAEHGPKERIWGVVIPFVSIQYDDLLSKVSAHAAVHGREVRRFYSYNNWEEEVRLVARMQVERYEAVVVIPTLDESRTWDFYSRLSPSDAPVVLLDHTMTYRDFPFVVQSYDLGVVRALNYLLDRKSGAVAFVMNEGWTGRNMVLELMTETYRMVLRRRQPDLEPPIFDNVSRVSADAIRANGITGVFCCDDISAIQAIGRLREEGVAVPGEVCFASYGNTALARYFTPALTSVDPHNEEMADHLAGMLTGGLGRNEMRQYVVQPELVIRET